MIQTPVLLNNWADSEPKDVFQDFDGSPGAA